jgi:NosR/NirI family transcriptional regulator, nitrous oxide reductase regulator
MESLYRFPAPDFSSGYQLPWPATPPPEGAVLFALDLLLLILALALTGYFALHRRSRKGITLILSVSLLYFGFIRGGCICPIGSVQNVALALADSSYLIPVTVIFFFFLPLLTALFFGRLFCGGPCPLGAIQDLVLLRPLRVPERIDSVLRLLPPVYLGVALLAAATDSGFIICRFDPFVSLFRFSGPMHMIIAGFLFLGIGIFVFRPYCRYLCPYGVLLGWISRFSWKHLSLKEESCAACGYCEDSCPEEAVLPPLAEPREAKRKGLRRLIMLLLLLPLIAAAGGTLGYLLHRPASRMNMAVALADRVAREEAGLVAGSTRYSEAFRESGKSLEILYTEALAVQETFRKGSIVTGLFLGLLFGLKLISTSLVRRRSSWTIDRSRCFSCGRCFDSCPVERRSGAGP